jgi:hypothetical protein
VTAAYREPAPKMSTDPPATKPRPKGTLTNCPLCGDRTSTRYGMFGYYINAGPKVPASCQVGRRVAVGIFRRCKLDGVHLHQRCVTCGARWVCDPVGVTEGDR